MADPVKSDHPIQRFVFCLSEMPSVEIRSRLSDLIDILAASRKWLIAPPVVAEMFDKEDPEETAMETVGGVLQLYSSNPPNHLPTEIDRQQLGEVEIIVASLCDFSSRSKVDFEFYLDHQRVGEITAGRPDPI